MVRLLVIQQFNLKTYEKTPLAFSFTYFLRIANTCNDGDRLFNFRPNSN